MGPGTDGLPASSRGLCCPTGAQQLHHHVPAGGKLSRDGPQGVPRGRPSAASPHLQENAKCQGYSSESWGPHRVGSERPEEGGPLG